MEKGLEDFLAELKKYGIKKHIPNISEAKGRLLNLLVKISGSKNILEIGCANGYSTIWLADAVKENGGKILAIDFSEPSYKAAIKNLSATGFTDTVEIVFGNALKILHETKNTFDFVFVDGEKRSYQEFWNLIKEKMEPEAIVIFDDILSIPEKTADFMLLADKLQGFDKIVMPMDDKDGIMILRKNKK